LREPSTLGDANRLAAAICLSIARRGGGALTAQKALAAKDRTALRRLEGHRGFPTALGAGGHGLGLSESSARSALALALARLTALGLILKTLIVEEVLFSRCEYEVCSAIYAL
jgi:hypothetical protein